MLKDQFGNIEILVPSVDANLDRKQWPEAEDHGIRFVASLIPPATLKWWHRTIRLFPIAKHFWLPRDYAIPDNIRRDVTTCDAVIMIGGDNISLDYSAHGLMGQAIFSEIFMREDKPMILWGASIGPFSTEPVFERYMEDFLNRLDLITVRETVTADYLNEIGVSRNVQLVADPAFLLQPQALPLDAIMPTGAGAGILGLNISPLVDNARYGRSRSAAKNTPSEVVQFVESAVRDHDLSVVMIPHVDPLGAPYGTSDTQYMEPIFRRLQHLGSRITQVPPTLNAAQLKYLIGQCRFLIGARTHATIASLSSRVPTLSIAYSVKARGLNRDLFGHERYVLPTPRLSAATLADGLQSLVDEEQEIRAQLEEKIPIWQERSRLSARLLAKCLS